MTEKEFDIVFEGILAKNRLAVFAANYLMEGVMFPTDKPIQKIGQACDVMGTRIDLSLNMIRAVDNRDMAELFRLCQRFERVVEMRLVDTDYRDNQPDFLDTFFNIHRKNN